MEWAWHIIHIWVGALVYRFMWVFMAVAIMDLRCIAHRIMYITMVVVIMDMVEETTFTLTMEILTGVIIFITTTIKTELGLPHVRQMDKEVEGLVAVARQIVLLHN